MKVQLSVSVILIIFLHHQPHCDAQTNANTSSRPPTVNNEFAWKLFKYSKPSNRNAENFILCPVSVQLALSVLQLASEGATKEQIKLVTGNAVPAQLYFILNPQGPTPEIKSANGIFVDSSEKLNKDVSLHIYLNGGDVFSVPLQSHSVQAKNFINQWASNATNGNIPQFLDAETDVSSLKALLASAVYFHSTWKYQFRPSEPRKFYTFFNEGRPTEYMQVNGYFKGRNIDLGKNIGGTMINLPYKDNVYSMFLIVPGPGITLNKFLSNLDHHRFTEIIRDPEDLHFNRVQLFMPKFKVSSKTSLVGPLQKMGLVDLFSPQRSRLTKLIDSGEPLRISEILQQSVLKVDEIGTIATSVTSAFVVPLSAAEPEPKIFVIDKPFISVIVETASQTPIFIAKITIPSEG